MEGSTPIMKDSTRMVNGGTPFINDNKLKFTIIALCSVVFTIEYRKLHTRGAGNSRCLRYDDKSLQTLSIGDNVITCPPFSCTGTPEDDIMIGTAARGHDGRFRR